MGLFGGSDTSALEMRIARLERLVADMAQAMGMEVPADPASDAIRDAVARGQKIEAIKMLRESTGMGLAEAKDAIERGTWEMALGR